MAIAVTCKHCGKSFRAKDELAGRAVRCPGCQHPLQIPAAGGSPGAARTATTSKPASTSPKLSAAAPAPDVNAAIRKIEEARQKRAKEQAEAAERQNELLKLAEDFDKVSGGAKSEAGKKKDLPGAPTAKVGEKATRVTTMTVAADRFGMLRGSLAWKYVLLLVFLVGGAWASTVFIQRVMLTSQKAVTVEKLNDADIEARYKLADEAALNGNWARVRDLLEEIKLAQPYRVNNFKYKELKQKLEKAVGG